MADFATNIERALCEALCAEVRLVARPNEILAVVTPLTFLGGAFYTVDMLPEAWRGIAQLNPVVHLISGYRWTFFNLQGDNVMLSLGVTALFIVILLGIVGWMFKTGYRLKN